MTRTIPDCDLIDDSPNLVRPISITVDGSHGEATARRLVRAAQLLYTFWHTGEESHLERAVDETFRDNTLPPGRPQGLAGPRSASTAFRGAVPDLTCTIDDLLVAGNKIAVRLRFRGHFTGAMDGIAGTGQEVDFIAFDIQHVGAGERAGKIVEDWHLEDNLTFLTQVGLVRRVQS
ncbi:ester cyclase [Kribbella sp. NPDC000426]|uniref:ester cyclase n=1 Tax=Kribbella sp. NPDC000426 TaxID=3154255 RepID=UPI003328DDB7